MEVNPSKTATCQSPFMPRHDDSEPAALCILTKVQPSCTMQACQISTHHWSGFKAGGSLRQWAMSSEATWPHLSNLYTRHNWGLLRWALVEGLLHLVHLPCTHLDDTALSSCKAGISTC